jgi:hypothetical protein
VVDCNPVAPKLGKGLLACGVGFAVLPKMDAAGAEAAAVGKLKGAEVLTGIVPGADGAEVAAVPPRFSERLGNEG